TDRVKISEVCYDPPENPETPFEFVELYNAGTSVAYLDGAVISDQGNNDTNEATFQFPGTPLTGTTIPLAPGEVICSSARPSAARTRESASSSTAARRISTTRSFPIW